MRRKGPVLLGAVLDEFLKNIGVERKVKEGMWFWAVFIFYGEKI